MAKASVVLSFHDILLHQSDVELLEGPYWLNDTIISFYFEYLEKTMFNHTKDLLFVSPEVTQCIKMVPSEEIKTFLEPLGMQKKKFVFFALNDNDSPDVAGGSHWSLLVYSKPENSFFHIDSSQMCNKQVAWEFAGHLIPYLSYERLDARDLNQDADNSQTGELKFSHIDCVQQSNGYDCGIHVISNAERLAEHAYLHGNISSCDLLIKVCPNVKRKEIADIIRNLASSS